MRKLINSFNKLKFDNISQGILNTKPLKYTSDPSVTIVSMVGHSTVNMYLIAIKSFIHNFGRGTIEAIDDGSLIKSDYKALEHHIPGIRITKAEDVNTYDSPSYISWKRLYRCQQLAQTSYVIQLDSDTVSLGPLIDVDNLVRDNKGFLIGSHRWSDSVHVDTLRDIVSHWNNTHVQPRAEAGFYKLDFFSDGTKYLRACAGFAGYPKGFASVDEIRALSRDIQAYVGEEWTKWGSEQTTTMCLISKCMGSKILPWPSYQNFRFPQTSEIIESMQFVHFIGSNRYDGGVYTKLVKDLYNKMV